MLVLDRDRASVGIVDATTSTVTDTVAVPPEETALALAGERVVVAADGDVWSVPASGFVDFDSDADPVLTFGAGAVTSVDPAGVMFAYTPSTGDVARVDAADEETVAARWQAPPIDDDHDVQVTSVDEHWVVLDATARTLLLDGRQVDLSGLLDLTDDPVLQAPALDGESVAIAHRHGPHHRRPRRRRPARPRRRGLRRPRGAAASTTAASTPRGSTARHGAPAPARRSAASSSPRRRAAATSPSSPTATPSC